jgi:hypothetical protein
LTVSRSLLAVVLGFTAFALLTGLATPAAMRAFRVEELATFQMGFFITNLAYVVVAALLAGYLTGRIARRLEIAHAAAVGLSIIITTFVAMRQRGAGLPGPYDMTTAGCGPISAMVGAAVAMIQRLRTAK